MMLDIRTKDGALLTPEQYAEGSKLLKREFTATHLRRKAWDRKEAAAVPLAGALEPSGDAPGSAVVEAAPPKPRLL